MISKNMPKTIVLSILVLSMTSFSVLISSASRAMSKNTQFQLDIDEILTVSITEGTSGATGAVGNFLRNSVGLKVTSNNGNGFTASMTTKTANTSLINTFSSDSIDTLSSKTAKSSFSSDRWGYSLSNTTDIPDWSGDVPDTSVGVNNATYKPLVGSTMSPITVLYTDSTASLTQDIYFGAKASANSDSGTYTNTVVFSVVSGIITNDNPVNPANPATPANDAIANDNSGTYIAAPTGDNSGVTVYNYDSSTESADTTTTVVAKGNTEEIEYTAPQGVSKIQEGMSLAMILAVTAAVTATSGAFFFILAKRRGDKEDEEDDDNYDY